MYNLKQKSMKKKLVNKPLTYVNGGVKALYVELKERRNEP